MNGPTGADNVDIDKVPPGLRAFWKPILDHWMADLYHGPEANKKALAAIYTYCESYARRHRDPNQVRAMISDLAQYPSEVRAVIYGEVVMYLDRARTHAILIEYQQAGTPAEKSATNDFQASLEEAARPTSDSQ